MSSWRYSVDFFPLGAIQKKFPRPKDQKEILIFWLVKMDKNTLKNCPEKRPSGFIFWIFLDGGS